MLRRLSVSRVALIEHCDIEFEGGFNVLTGETGAGKSILVDALKLALGGKADRDLIRRGEKRAYVEAHFDLPKEGDVPGILEQQQIVPEDDRLVLSREVSASGKSAARIDGVLVPVFVLRDVASGLIDIYGQHDHQSLLNPASHLAFLDASDASGEIQALRAELSGRYAQLCALEKKLREEAVDPRERERRLDILRFQRDEIGAARLKPDEEETLTKRREKLVAAEEIAQCLEEARQSASNAADALADAADALRRVAGYDALYKSAADALDETSYQLEDVRRDLRAFASDAEPDPRELSEVEARLEAIFELERKYGGNIAEVLRFAEEAQRTIEALEGGAQSAEALLRDIEKETDAFYKTAENCSQKRREAARRLAAALVAELRELGMDKTRFEIRFEDLPSRADCRERMASSGLDRIAFLISPNPGIALKPLASTVSGGELSRLMLAFKTVSADAYGVDSMVFDEVDSGVGGVTAWAVAEKLARVALTRQVLCVTHLAAVAATADAHFRIEKLSDGDDTVTRVTPLDEEGRLDELARMSGGRKGETDYRAHAETLLRQARGGVKSK